MYDDPKTNKEILENIKKQVYAKDDRSDSERRIGIILRNVFIESQDGPAALDYLLGELRYNRIINHPEEMGLHNVAIRMLALMDFHGETSTRRQIESWRARSKNEAPDLDRPAE